MSELDDEKLIEEREQKEILKFKQEISDLKFVLSTPQGRRLLWRYLEFAGVYEQSAHASGSWTYFNEGRRSVGLKLLAEITAHDPESYFKMILENKKEQGEFNDRKSRGNS